MSTPPSDLKAFSFNVNKWRKNRPYIRSRLPAILRAELPALCAKYGLSEVSKATNLDMELIRRLIGKSPKEPNTTFLPVKIKSEAPVSLVFPVELCTRSGISIKVSSANLKEALRLLKDQGLC
jgi:hypothetical protein